MKFCLFTLGLFFCALIFVENSHAEDQYFMCGPDEDGCPSYDYTACTCIAATPGLFDKPYCFDEKDWRCIPLSQEKTCDPDDIYKNQGSCLALIFQSEPEPPCPLKKRSFCIKHHIPFDAHLRF